MSDLKKYFPELWEELQEKMREGPPPEDPGREGVGKSLFNQASAKNKAQGNKKYVAETRRSSYKKMTQLIEGQIPGDELIGISGPEAITLGKPATINKKADGSFNADALVYLRAGDKVKVVGKPKKAGKSWRIPVKPVNGGRPFYVRAEELDFKFKMWDK